VFFKAFLQAQRTERVGFGPPPSFSLVIPATLFLHNPTPSLSGFSL